MFLNVSSNKNKNLNGMSHFGIKKKLEPIHDQIFTDWKLQIYCYTIFPTKIHSGSYRFAIQYLNKVLRTIKNDVKIMKKLKELKETYNLFLKMSYLIRSTILFGFNKILIDFVIFCFVFYFVIFNWSITTTLKYLYFLLLLCMLNIWATLNISCLTKLFCEFLLICITSQL
jgi:hypothetical protein